MKTSIITLIGLSVLGVACKEIPPDISFECQTDRKVIVEEFTGVKCVNCPTGSEKIEQLHDQYGDQLIAISVHAGFFSVPFPESPEDFTTADGEAIDAWAGPTTGWPAAMINRRLFSGESTRILGLSAWAGKIAGELCEEPIASVNVSSSYNASSRQVAISVSGAGLTTDIIPEVLGLSVLITESGIIAPQTTPEMSKDTNYVHKHVLRDIITDYQGEDIHAGGTVLAPYQENFSYTLPAHWVPANCKVIAFVHYKTGSKLDIVQAAETDLE